MAGAEYIATGAYFTYHAGKYVLSKAGAERIVKTAWDVVGTGQPGYAEFLKRTGLVIVELLNKLNESMDDNCEEVLQCIPSH